MASGVFLNAVIQRLKKRSQVSEKGKPKSHAVPLANDAIIVVGDRSRLGESGEILLIVAQLGL